MIVPHMLTLIVYIQIDLIDYLPLFESFSSKKEYVPDFSLQQ